MAINKVVYGNQTLIDLTTDTVASSDDILAGKVGHLRDGTVVTGTASGGDQHGTIWQDGQGYVHLDDESGIALQSKTATPTESQQVIEADTGYYALDKVTVGAISSSYVGSGIARRSSSDLTANGATVTAPAGYYSASASKSVASGSVVPSIEYSGDDISVWVENTGLVHVEGGYSATEYPVSTSGWIDSSAFTEVEIALQNTYQLSTQAAKTVTPTTSSQTAVTAGKYTTGAVTVAAMPTGTAGTPTATKGTVSNHAVTVTPSVTNTTGYITGGTKTGTGVSVSASELVSGTYSVTSSGTKDVTNYASISVPAGTEGTPTATKGSVSNHSVSVTPSVTNTAGYIGGSTKTGTAVTVSASELVSGTKSITENGTGIDVTNYASVDVNVSGGGGGAKLGALRSDAELIKTWSGDYLAVSDLGANIPAYSTSSTSVLSTSQLPDSVTLDLSSYRYIICIRRVITPVYATVINTKGRCEYTFRAATFEVVYFPAGCFSENNHNDSYSIPLVNEYFGIVYQTAPSTAYLAANAQTGLSSIYGVHDGTPLIGNFMDISWSNPTLTITALRPALYMRYSNTYFTQEHWENVSDIRMQYVTEIWRVPKGGVDGFNIQSQTNHILDCVMNERELT